MDVYQWVVIGLNVVSMILLGCLGYMYYEIYMGMWRVRRLFVSCFTEMDERVNKIEHDAKLRWDIYELDRKVIFRRLQKVDPIEQKPCPPPMTEDEFNELMSKAAIECDSDDEWKDDELNSKMKLD